MDKLTNLRNRIFNKNEELNVIYSWHVLMKNYGWIPFDEFLELDAKIVMQLHKNIIKDIKRENERNKI